MNWLQRVMRLGNAPAASDSEAEGWLRDGYEREYRGDPAGAEQLYRRVLAGDPQHADAHYLLGRLADWDKRHDEALELFRRAVELRPREAIFLLAYARCLIDAGRFADAIDVYRACIALLPDCTTMQIDYAAALIGLDRREEARGELERLRERMPDLVEVHFNLGCIYQEHGGAAESIASYRKALELRPDRATIWHNLLLELNYSDELGAAAIFADHRRFGERFSRRSVVPVPDPAWPRPLRVGYVSPDFRNHVVMKFFEPILAHADGARFQTFCYATSRHKDSVTERLRGLASQWVDCEEMTDDQLADRIRSDRIDILVDLAGHTLGNRLLAFAMKPAPVQATYLGYPNTTGLGAVDFRISDAYADPPGESDRLCVERVVRLPGSFLCYRPEAETPAVVPLPAVDSGHVTFGCFNNFMKLSPAFLDTAAQVLAAVPGSRLLLKGRPLASQAVADSVRARFERHGIDRTRLELRGWEASPRSHLAVYGEIDIALDSFPYNGTTTTCEAMWMGVPVVSLVGDRHASRVGSSLLNAVGLGDLVAQDSRGYVAICEALANDLPRLKELRDGLRERMRRSPLMDEPGFTRKFETCLLELWQHRHRPGAMQAESNAAPDDGLVAKARQMKDAGRFAEGQALCEEVLQRMPVHLEALTLLWDIAHERGAPGSAIDALARAIAADGGLAPVHYMLGCVFQAQEKIPDAIAAFRRALALDPAQAKTHNNLGCMLEAAGDLAAAAECYRGAIGLDQRMAQAHYNLGNAYRQLGDAEKAATHIGRALAVEPGHADWRCNLGSLHFAQGRIDAAIADFRLAVEADPGYGRAHSDLGEALLLVGRVEDARHAFTAALAAAPERPDLESQLLRLQQYREDQDAAASLQMHRAWAGRHARGLARATAHVARPATGRRLNVGYVSAAFSGDVFARFVAPVLAAHDRSAFNVFCYSATGPADVNAERSRVGCEHWRDLSRSPDDEVADRVRADGIDILVDLAGHANGGRPLLFARKAAPLQLLWLGYPASSGLDSMDYRLTDAIADPAGPDDAFYTETLVRLSRGFLCYAPAPACPEVAVPSGAGQIVFGCFTELARITPSLVALWARILQGVPGARLVVEAAGLAADSARQALQAQFAGHGVGAERIDLRAAAESEAMRLAGYSRIDIALDTHPVNGTTQTCDALWMGVPVVTLAGASHVSRAGASILAGAGLRQFVERTPDSYVAKAIALASDHAQLRALRPGMRQRLSASALLDVRGFTLSLESTYRDLWQRACKSR